MTTTASVHDGAEAGGPGGAVMAAAVAICLAAAMLEGFDLQSIGVTARKLAAAYHLRPDMMGWVASASIIGLLPGAAIGGRLADRFGRKTILVWSVVAFGVFTLCTTVADSYPTLLAARFLTGLGLGGALPNLIALCSEMASSATRSRVVGVMYAGMPLGGALAALVSIANGGRIGWRVVFYVGGVLPLLITPLLLFVLRESAEFRRKASDTAAPRASMGEVLFGQGRAAATLLLWVSFFFTLMVLYLLLNWLPTLLVGKGLTPVQAGLVQLVFNVGGAAGSLVFSWFLDRGSRRWTAAAMYLGIIASLIGLAVAQGFGPTIWVSAAVGVFAVGGQIVLYALAPIYYPTLMRGAGVGAAVAVGRLGSMAGPLLAGALLSSGMGAAAVLLAAVPGLVVAGATGVALVARPGAPD